MTPDSWVDPDYHWQPPADAMYTYDPAKARQLLDDAGYKDTDGDGVREDRSGKPIKLRLWARAESPESQKTGSLITGWFRDLGLKIEYQVMDDGIYYDSIWAYEGDTYSPDFDMYLWNYDGYADPGDTLASFITAQIENWNEPCWSNAEYDAVVDEANTTLDPEKRKELVWRAQQIFYEQSPEIATDYPDKLEAIDTAHWDGWTRMYGGTGAAFYTSYVRDSYLDLKPKAAGATADTGGASGLMIAIVAAVVVVAVVAVASCSCAGGAGRPRRSSESGAGAGGGGSRRQLLPPVDLHAVLARALRRVERGGHSRPVVSATVPASSLAAGRPGGPSPGRVTSGPSAWQDAQWSGSWSGDCRGLQNRLRGDALVLGGFDSHVAPPSLPSDAAPRADARTTTGPA